MRKPGKVEVIAVDADKSVFALMPEGGMETLSLAKIELLLSQGYTFEPRGGWQS